MNWIFDMLSFVYPRVCAGCGASLSRHDSGICNTCYVSLPKTNFHLLEGNPMQKIFEGRVKIDRVAGYLFFNKQGRVQKMLHAIKYRNKPGIAHLLGKWYGLELKRANTFSSVDYILPVPLHKKRQRKRGYNQSEYFAGGLAEELGLPVVNDILIKKRFTETQTYKSREERWRNTQGSFEIVRKERLEKKHVLLVDDVVTTGATTEACAVQLEAAGCKTVSIAAIAYTPR